MYRPYVHLGTRTTDRIRDAGRQWILVGAAAGALLGSRLLDLPEHPYLLLHPLGGWFSYLTTRSLYAALWAAWWAWSRSKNAWIPPPPPVIRLYDYGRFDNFNPRIDLFSLTEVSRGVIGQSPVFTTADLLPVPAIPTRWRWLTP